MTTGIGLLSGGLDSMLAVRVLQDQGITVHGVSYETPFFSAKKGRKVSEMLGISFSALNITHNHLPLVKKPKYGYGKNMNPCIDCHTLMLRTAGRLMKEIGADFIFTGEVLGQRPKSQTRQALELVANESGYKEYIIRPLSAQLLPITPMEEKGLIDRTKLYAFEGRSRKPQIKLAEKYGLTEWESPAGGCLLTYSGFSSKLRELLEHSPNANERDMNLLKIGRHFRLPHGDKLIVGRNETENTLLESHASAHDILLFPPDINGPTAVLINPADETDILLASNILLRYCKNIDQARVTLTWPSREISKTIFSSPLSARESAQYLVSL